MFDQYFQLAHRLRKHYLNPSVILCLVTGRFVPPIHRRILYSMQYSMLPARRAGMMEIWSRLTEKPKKHMRSNGDPAAMLGIAGMTNGATLKVPNAFGPSSGRRGHR